MTKPLPIAVVRVAPYDYHCASHGGRLRLDDGLVLQPWTEFHTLCRYLHAVVSETLMVQRWAPDPSFIVR